MNIGKTKDNYDKDEKPKCFNCNTYKCIVKNTGIQEESKYEDKEDYNKEVSFVKGSEYP